MQSNEQQIHLMYEVSNEGNMMMYNEEAMQGTQEHFNGTTLDVKEKKPPRRYLSAQEEECLFEIWGRDNWRLTQPGKNMAIFNKWSQELKERFDVDLKPLEIQTKVNANRLKFRQVLKQCATDKTAFKKWKNFHLVGKILSNQYRALDAEEISPEDLKKNRDMVFIESMSGFLNDANSQSLEENSTMEKDEAAAVENQQATTIVKTEQFFATHNENNDTAVNNTELNQILVTHDAQQNQQLYHYLQQHQQQQQQQQQQQPQQMVVISQEKTEEQLIVNAQQHQQQQAHDTDYYEETLEQQQQHQQQQQQQPQEQLLHLQQQGVQQNMQLLQPQQQQHEQQYADTLNTYLSLSQAQAQAHVSVIQTNQTQQEVQPPQQQQQQPQIQYQQSIMLPLQHQAHNNEEPTLFVKPTAPAPAPLAPLMQQYLDPNQVWDSQKVVTSPLLQTKRTYRSRTSNTKQSNQHQDIKDKINHNKPDDKMMMMNPICANQAQAQVQVASTSMSEFSAAKKRRISSIANSKEILKFREEWLKQQDIKTKQKDEPLLQQQELKASEVVSNTSLKGATEVEMLYLAEVCRRNEIMAEQRNISSKLLRLEERKVALMESFFPKCFKLQEEFLERTLKQSPSKKKITRNVNN